MVGTRRFGSASDLAYRYTGQEFDGETGLHNFRARMYDSEWFRFYATDPADEQHSPYAFVGNSPLMFRDPTGMIADEITVWATAPTNPVSAIFAVLYTLAKVAIITPMIAQAATPVVQPPQSYPSADYYRTSIEFRNKQMQLLDGEPMYHAKEITVFGDEAISATKGVSLQEGLAGLSAMGAGIDGLYPRSMQQLRDMRYADLVRENDQRSDVLITGVELATMGIGAGGVVSGLSGSGINTISSFSLRLLPGNTKWGLQHIIQRHFASVVTHFPEFAQKSKFFSNINSVELNKIIKLAGETGNWVKDRDGWIMLYDIGRVIGTDISGNATSVIKIVADKSGRVITAFPF